MQPKNYRKNRPGKDQHCQNNLVLIFFLNECPDQLDYAEEEISQFFARVEATETTLCLHTVVLSIPLTSLWSFVGH